MIGMTDEPEDDEESPRKPRSRHHRLSIRYRREKSA